MSDVRDRRFFDYDPFNRVTEYFHYDPDTDGFGIEYVQDVEPLLDFNKYLYNNAPLRFGDFNHVASLPKPIVIHLIREGILGPGGGYIKDEERFRKFLNDRDNRFFRTWPANV